MERMTKRDEDGCARLTKFGMQMYCSTQATADCLAKLEDRLAAYEDTRLEPQTISEILDSVSEWYDAHKEGRLLVLPCKPMTTVYVIEHVDCYMDTEACPLLDQSGRCNGEGEMPCPLHIVEVVADIDSLAKWIVLNAFNNTVFLTHKAAEAALKEREGK